jgi:hypothetical protein
MKPMAGRAEATAGEAAGGRYAGMMQSEKYVIFMTYADYRIAAAGIEKYIMDEIDLLRSKNVSALCVFPFPTRRSERLARHLSNFWGVIIDGRICGFYDVGGVIGIVAELRRAGRIPLEIQIHHLMHFDLERAGRLLRDVPVGVKLFLHDYHTVCPQYNLLRNGKEYCGDDLPSHRKCAGCTSWTPLHHEAIRGLLQSVEDRLLVVSPSRSAEQIWLKSFPDFGNRTRVVPHLKMAGTMANPFVRKNAEEPIRLAYVGAPVSHKGWEIFSRLAGDLSRAGRNYEFYHFGRPAMRDGKIANIPISFVENGPAAMTEAIQKAKIDVVLLWSIWPETYSYTMYESRMANVMLITNPQSGNIADTVGGQDWGRSFRHYGELLEYAMNVDGVRKDIDFYRGKSKALPARLVTNEAILDLIDFAPTVLPDVEGGPIRRCWHVGALYCLKLWKKRISTWYRRAKA